jgi:C_GCAxxG_C_C family probable redox protein
MENMIAKAVEYFSGEFNCSQSVFGAYAPLWGMDHHTALKIASGFGAGMACFQHTCGAVTGAFMLIGLAHGKWQPDDNESKEKTYALIREFTAAFTDLNKFINCRELLGCDISTPEGLKKAREAGLFATKCKKYVKDAATIIERILLIPTGNS